MTAVVLAGSRRVGVVERPDTVLGSGDVLVQVPSSTLCRSDLSLYDGTPVVDGSPAGTGTIVPGQEASGEVAAPGPGVDGLAVGDRIAVHRAFGCDTCGWCLRGYRMRCAICQCVGLDVDGGGNDPLASRQSTACPSRRR